MSVKASDLLVECLEEEGVEHVFGLPGEENEDMMFSLRDSDIEFVTVRHEQGAAFMANVYGRVTNEAGVCLSTLGPGATNLMTGVADAQLDKAPLVAITGQGDLERLHKESHQAIDIVDMFKPITKWNTSISDPEIITESVRKAFKVSEQEKPGATHIELPEDVAAERVNDKPLDVGRKLKQGAPNPDVLDEAFELLREADRPIVITGNGAVRSGAADAVREFVDNTDIPVASTYMGKGVVSDDDPRSLLTLESGEHHEAVDAIDDADLLITVGYDIAEHDPADYGDRDTNKLIHIDSEPAEVYKAYEPDVEIVSDITAGAEALAEWSRETGTSFDTEWYTEFREHIVEDIQHEREGEFTVKGVLPVLREVLADDDILISDVGWHKMAIAQNYPTYEPNTCIIDNGLASMGIAVPGGLAADLASDSNVVAATGDGGFLMNGAEINTAMRNGCGYTVLLFNNDELDLITYNQEKHKGGHYGTELTNPDFIKLAESYGLETYRPQDWNELENDLQEAVESNQMSLVEVYVKGAENE